MVRLSDTLRCLLRSKGSEMRIKLTLHWFYTTVIALTSEIPLLIYTVVTQKNQAQYISWCFRLQVLRKERDLQHSFGVLLLFICLLPNIHYLLLQLRNFCKNNFHEFLFKEHLQKDG